MTKQEFLDFCHEEFTKRGFEKKRKNMYYLKGKDLLAGLYLQKSMAEAYYIEYDYFIGEFDDVKSYPTVYDSDIHRRIEVLSKDTVNGEHFMDACIEYGLYTKEELEPYFSKVFEKYIIPPIINGKHIILKNKEHYFRALFSEELDKVLNKLNNQGTVL